MNTNNIIKETVLRKVKEQQNEGTADCAAFDKSAQDRWFVAFYCVTKCDNGNTIYEIRLTNSELYGEKYIQASWEQEESVNGNTLRFHLGHPTRNTQHTIMNLEAKALDLMLPVNKELITQGFENEDIATSFIDTWNNAITEARSKSLYLQTAELCENIIKAQENAQKRKKNTEWQTICETTKALRGTSKGKALARKLIQTYLQREKQNTRQQ